MKDNVKDLAIKIARLNANDLRELEGALLNNGISATLYRFSPTTSMWDNKSETYGVYLKRTGNRKLLLIKTIKELLGLGLKEAKDIVDSCPCVITELSYESAEGLKNELQNCGATIEIRES
jgi:large subunit ribosomal protein L7/L12